MFRSSLPVCLVLFGAVVSAGQPKPDNEKVTDPRLKAILDTFKHHDAQIEKAGNKADAAVKAIGEIEKKNALTQAELKKLAALGRDIESLKAELTDTQKVLSDLRASLPKPAAEQVKADAAIKHIQDRLTQLETPLGVVVKSVDAKIDALPPAVRAHYLPVGSKWDCTFRDKSGEGKFQFVVTGRDGDNVSGSCVHEGKTVYTVSGTFKSGVWTFNQHFVPASGQGRIKRTFTLTSDGTKFTGSSPGVPSLSSKGDLDVVPSK